MVGQVAGENPSIRLSVIVDDDPSGDFDGDGYRDHSDLDDDDDGHVDEIDRFPPMPPSIETLTEMAWEMEWIVMTMRRHS